MKQTSRPITQRRRTTETATRLTHRLLRPSGDRRLSTAHPVDGQSRRRSCCDREAATGPAASPQAPLESERPESLQLLDRYFSAATIAHEYIADLHRELVALGQDDEQRRERLDESAALVLERMSELTGELRRLERDWTEQRLLDPSGAERTLRAIEHALVELEPQLDALRVRQDEIAGELRERIKRARR